MDQFPNEISLDTLTLIESAAAQMRQIAKKQAVYGELGLAAAKQVINRLNEQDSESRVSLFEAAMRVISRIMTTEQLAEFNHEMGRHVADRFGIGDEDFKVLRASCVRMTAQPASDDARVLDVARNATRTSAQLELDFTSNKASHND